MYVEILLWSIVTLWLFKGNLVGCVTIWKRLQKSDLRLKSLFLFLYEQLLLSQLIFQLPRLKISKSGIPGDDPNPFQTEILPYCLESSKKVFFYVNVNGKFFFAIKGQRKVIFSASVAQLDKQETICCMAESSRHKFESDLRPFATCLLLLLPLLCTCPIKPKTY